MMVKRLLFVSMVLVISACLASHALAANILSNSGFDNDVIPDGTQINPPTPYDSWGAYTPAGHAIYNPAPASALQPNSGENLLYAVTGAAVNQHVSLTPGMTYQLSAYVRNFPGEAYPGYLIGLWDGVSDDNALAVGDLFYGVYGIEQGASGNTSDWTLVTTSTYVATAEDAGKDYQVQVYAYGGDAGAYMCFDDVVLTEVPEPASMALLAMGGLALLRRRLSA
ncbi:MAG: PEP-CTERM sorting domain-containing protein [Sedimentisphaerales bacterium]|nr:PEP-CTERM sorting domain-containing protein [Sedimentisphaerales bacterium]